MTYFGVLLTFIAPPLVLLALLTIWDSRRGKTLMGSGFLRRNGWLVVFAHVIIALVWTSPWDNYLVASEVWWYDDALVTGITIGYVPIEEYTFFIVQTLMTGLWTLALSRYGFADMGSKSPDNYTLRRWGTWAMVALFFASLAVLLSGWEPGIYMALILIWVAVPFGIQFAFGADILLARWQFVLTGIAVPSLYLWAVDAYAINSGTWTISPDQTVGLLIGGILPLEEALFFTVTNILIVFGVTLMLAEESHPRAIRWWEIVRQRISKKELIHGDSR
jgi:lycopene beta-cyclase